MRRFLSDLMGRQRSIENARGACVELSRHHVERDEVELFLQRHAERAAKRAM
jgi:hypothetical protein